MGGIERKRVSQRIHQCLSSVSDVALPPSFCLALSPAISFSLCLLYCLRPTLLVHPGHPTDPTFDLAGESLVLRWIRRRFLEKINRFEQVAERPHARCGNGIAFFFHLHFAGKLVYWHLLFLNCGRLSSKPELLSIILISYLISFIYCSYYIIYKYRNVITCLCKY